MHEIFWKDKSVGYADIKQEGLYFRFFCTCIPPHEGIFRVQVSDGESIRDLGICVPEGDKFTLSARVPIKYLNRNNISFILVGKENAVTSLPVATGEPFTYLDKLETARLDVTNGQPEIVIDSIPDPQDSDPSLELPHRSELQ